MTTESVIVASAAVIVANLIVDIFYAALDPRVRRHERLLGKLEQEHCCRPVVRMSVSNFGGAQEFTTWDGEPVSRERPHGATVVVASRAPHGWRYLLLHRAHDGGPDREGDWAWTPPSGSRKPGEDLFACVTRELREEVGWTARPRPVRTGDVDWAVFALEVPWGTEVVVDGEEHDRFEWLDFAEARRRCRPAELEASFLAGCKAALSG